MKQIFKLIGRLFKKHYRQRPADWPKSGWYWLLHHEQLLEWTDDIDERWQYIVENKPKNEIDLRLSEIAPVRGDLPKQIIDAYAERKRAYGEWERAYAERGRAERGQAERERAYGEWKRAYDKHKTRLEVMHKLECPDSKWNGKTILETK